MSRLEVGITTHHDLETTTPAYVKHWITQVVGDSGFQFDTEPDGSTSASVTVRPSRRGRAPVRLGPQ
jgi:hypothetical protein